MLDVLFASSRILKSILFARYIFAYEGAGFTPMAVPISCLHVEEWNSNKLCLRSISISLTIKSDFWDPSVASVMHWMPSSCGMLVYAPVASIVARIAFLGVFCLYLFNLLFLGNLVCLAGKMDACLLYL